VLTVAVSIDRVIVGAISNYYKGKLGLCVTAGARVSALCL